MTTLKPNGIGCVCEWLTQQKSVKRLIEYIAIERARERERVQLLPCSISHAVSIYVYASYSQQSTSHLISL